MANQLTVISGNKVGEERTVHLPGDKHKHYKNVMGVLLQDAQNTWGDLWNELQGEVVDGVMILPEAEKGLKPKCGWPEFLEKMWVLKSQLDHAKRFSNGTP